MLDSNSWSYNYGHYINDNVIPAFSAAKVFNLPFDNVQQVFETKCRQFSTLEHGFHSKIVDYNHSMGTYQQACLEKVEGLRHHFFNRPPMYLDELKNNGSPGVCFRQLMAGHGKCYSLSGLDLSKGIILREFRDYVISRLPQKPPPQENIILVAKRTVGTAGGSDGGSRIHDLCERVKKYNSEYMKDFKVVCIVPTDLSFEEEINYVQRSKILISLHGTISYISLFSRDGTQQISISNPRQYKESHILLQATHFNTLYLPWDQIQSLGSVIDHSIDLSNQFHFSDGFFPKSSDGL